MINPPMPTLSPVPTCMRVERLTAWAGVAVGVAAGVAVAVADGVTVAVAVAVAVGVGVGVGEGVTTLCVVLSLLSAKSVSD